MRNLVLIFGALFALSMFSCIGDKEQNVQPEETDSIKNIETDTALLVTGVAIDGAMNSVFLKVGDDTIEFSYPDLDSEYRASWEIDDTLTIRYYVTENGDSVTEVINDSDA